MRSFVAFDVDEPVAAALRALQSVLRDSGADVRWTRPEGLHLTLKFLGSVTPDRLAAIAIALRGALAAEIALPLRVASLGAFPDLQRPRVLWAGVTHPDLPRLARQIDVGLAGLGFARETRALHPHITLGRVRSLSGWRSLRARIEAHQVECFGVSMATSVALYRSDLQPDGAVHTLLDRIHLTPAGGAMDNSTSRK